VRRERFSHWTSIIRASIFVAISVFGLLAKDHRPSSSPSTAPENISEVQVAGSDNNVCCKDCQCAPVPFKEPSPVFKLGILIDLKYWQSVEQLLEDDPLAETYIPFVVLKFPDVYSPVRTDLVSLENASAPDGFAARFDAPQVALLTFQALRYMVEHFPTHLDLARYVVFGTAIILCFALHVMVFLVTGRFGRRGIKKLIKGFKGAKLSVRSSSLLKFIQCLSVYVIRVQRLWSRPPMMKPYHSKSLRHLQGRKSFHLQAAPMLQTPPLSILGCKKRTKGWSQL